ncbi:MAG: hemerythrin domain-containing protein [Candidatus Nanopelagicales bacterium]|nr:hemerythrin domain-containing protein [Candidatus Nanopelagicales bacterium]
MSQGIVTVASNPEDSQMAEAVISHHAAMVGRVDELVGAVAAAITAGVETGTARDAVVAYFRNEVLPHAKAEESTLYEAAARNDRARMLIETMTVEHDTIAESISRLEQAEESGAVGAAAGALDALFTTHVGRENDFVIPLLAGDPSVSLAGLVEGLHELIGGEESQSESGKNASGCGCGCGHG